MVFNNFSIIPDINNIEQYLELAKEYGMTFEYNDFFMPSVLDDEKRVNELIERYKALTELPSNATLHGAFLDVTIFSQDKRVRELSEERIRQSLDIADRIGASAVIIHTNYIANFIDDSYRNHWIEANEQFLRRVLYEYPNIKIYMENMFDTEPELLSKLADRMKDNDRFGVCLDYAHVNVFGQDNKEEWITKLAPYVKHIHINDNDLIQDSHMALGTGKIDYLEFFEYYKKYFPDAGILLEMKGIDKIRQSIDYIREKIRL